MYKIGDIIDKIHCSDCLSFMRQMPDKSINCGITSPAYWGLRDYGTSKWEGGDINCDHSCKRSDKISKSTLLGRGSNLNHEKQGWTGGICGKCGAKRIDKQLGLERTPEEYVVNLVNVFREFRRILRDDGTLWLNLGDSYIGSWGNYGGQNRGCGRQRQIINGSRVENPAYIGKEKWRPPTTDAPGLKQKDLAGIPWRTAFALQADGWWLRQDIIWSKGNPMPESVTDRCTKSHEYVFFIN